MCQGELPDLLAVDDISWVRWCQVNVTSRMLVPEAVARLAAGVSTPTAGVPEHL